MNSIDKIKSLIHESNSPTVVDEVLRRIKTYNRLQTREIDYLIAGIRDTGLTDKVYNQFQDELASLTRSPVKTSRPPENDFWYHF